MTLRILQVVPYFCPAFGGPVSVVHNLSRELGKRNHKVSVCTTDIQSPKVRLGISDNHYYVNGFYVQYFKNVPGLSSFYFSPSMIQFAIKEVPKFDVIHLHGYRTFPNVVIAHYAMKYVVPYVLQAHGSLPRIMAWQRLKWSYDVLFGYRLLRDAAKVVALSQVEAQQYKAMGVPEEKIAIIPNGIDLSEYGDLPPKGAFKKKFNIDDEERIVLYLGRIHRIKGIDILVRAFADVVENLDDVKLVVVGPDDGYLGELEALTKALKIEDNVLILGPLYGKDKLEAYVDADVYVLPSRYETFPMSLLEAYACSKTIVASTVGGLKELVINGTTGLLFESGNIKQLVHYISSLLDDEAEAEKMGLRGRRFVENNFSIKKIAEKLEELYRRTVVTNVKGYTL